MRGLKMEESVKEVTKTVEKKMMELTLVVEPYFIHDIEKMRVNHNKIFGTDLSLSEYIPTFIYRSMHDYKKLEEERDELKGKLDTQGIYG